MGEFSTLGSADFDQRIHRDLEEITHHLTSLPSASVFKALVLLGGYGRGEGTPWIHEGKQLPFNDYDLIVVSEPLSWMEKGKVKQELHGLEHFLTEKMAFPVDFYLHTTRSLASAENSMMNQELKAGHRVIWGDQDVLVGMPHFPPLPLSEGTRLMLNRGTLLLMLKEGGKPLNQLEGEKRLEGIKFIHKVHLAMGDCALLSEGIQSIFYTEKKERILEIVSRSSLPHLDWVAKVYGEAIAFKEWADLNAYSQRSLTEMYEELLHHFVPFFLGYESKRLGCEILSIEEYERALQGEPKQQEPLWKSVILNLLLLKENSFRPHWQWLFVHPRYRLFPAMLRLLQGDEEQGQRLIGGGPIKFFTLRDRLS